MNLTKILGCLCCIFILPLIGTALDLSAVSTANDSGPGSLRQAIADSPPGSTITFDSSLSGQTIVLTSGEIILNKNLTIDGSSLLPGVALSGGGNSRVFTTSPSTTCTLIALTFTGGNGVGATDSGNGGAIYNRGDLTLQRCTGTGNATQAGGNGGVIFSTTGGNLVLQQCTFSGNSAGNRGGAVLTEVGSTASIAFCSFANNAAIAETAIRNNATLTLSGCAISGSVYNSSAGSITRVGVNIVSIMTSDGSGPGLSGPAHLATEPLLAALGSYGGPTKTMPPQPSSPAIDAADDTAAAAFSTDQRGLPRLIGPHADVGAVEFQDATPVVTNNNDSGTGSLRYAATYSPSRSTITFDSSLSGQTIVLTSGEITLSKNFTIDASSLAAGITLSGGGNSRVFMVEAGASCALTSLTITNAVADFGSGLSNFGEVTLNDSTITGCLATYDGGGGAVYNEGLMTINQCTFSGNTANSVYFGGGGVRNDNEGTLSIYQSTISGNTAIDEDGSGLSNGGHLTLANTIVGGNSGPGSQVLNYGTITFVGANIVPTLVNRDFGNITGPAPITSAPLLAALGNYGGRTSTMPPLPNSPALDAADDDVAVAFATDQRGSSRTLGGHADIGAVEGAFTPSFQMTNATLLGDGSFHFQFTNLSGANYQVLTTTDIALPLNQWTVLGQASEMSPNSGIFEFNDDQVMNHPQRFYVIALP